jgi:hypothetical protein
MTKRKEKAQEEVDIIEHAKKRLEGMTDADIQKILPEQGEIDRFWQLYQMHLTLKNMEHKNDKGQETL